MAHSVADLLARLERDPLREGVSLSPAIGEATAKILELGDDEAEIQSVLNHWIGQHQPCLFGRLAAKKGLLSYCILTEADLKKDDASIQKKIQKA